MSLRAAPPALAPAAGICRLCAATAEQRPIAREEKGGWGQWLYECGQCGALYLDPDMTAHGLEQFYQQDYRRFYPFEAHQRLDEAFLHAVRCFEVGYRRAKAVAPLMPIAGRVLEIGSGYGGFLAALGQLRPDVQRVAIEPDEANRYAALGLNKPGESLLLSGAEPPPVIFTDWGSLGVDEAPFDLIVLFHTLEHVLDPVADLQRLAAVLVPTGRLLFEVPKTTPNALTQAEIHPAHVTYFTEHTARMVVERTGLFPLQPQAAHGALPGCLWQEAGCVGDGQDSPVPPAVAAQPPRAVPAGKRWLKQVLQAVLPLSWQGRLSRWRQGPALDRDLLEPSPLSSLTDEAGARSFCWGLPFDCAWTTDSLLRAASQAMAQGVPLRVADMNVAKVLSALGSGAFRRSLLTAQAVVVDGMGVLWGLRWLGMPAAQRIAGSDLLGHALALCERERRKVYVVGARPDVIERAATRIQALYPDLALVGWQPGYFTPEQDGMVAEKIAASGAECVIAALPYPRQDLFLARIHHACGAAFVFGVGGSLDVFVGDRRRAPVWVQRSGMEWFYRLLQEPRRLLGRYLVSNGAFLMLLLREKIARKGA